jgi:acyl-CoA thioesterase FadM
MSEKPIQDYYPDDVAHCYTASLLIDFLEPTPLDTELEARGTIQEIKGRKVVIGISVYADGREAARGRVVAVQAPDDFMERLIQRMK